VEARGIHHVGVAVADLDEAVRTYERLFGGRLEHRARVEAQGVEAASIRFGESRVELLAPLGEDTPVGKFIAKRGPGLHHLAYEVDDVASALADLAEQGAELIRRRAARGSLRPRSRLRAPGICSRNSLGGGVAWLTAIVCESRSASRAGR